MMVRLRIPLVVLVLSVPFGATASPIDWQFVGASYGVQEWGPGFGGPNYGDYSYTLGVPASISFDPSGGMTLGTGSAMAGDNGQSSLKTYAGTTYNGPVGGGTMKSLVNAWGQQTWYFSLDHAAPLELSYSVDGSIFMSGPYASGSMSVSLKVLRWWAWTVETVTAYDLQIDQSQPISEHGTFAFDYDPSWGYGLYMQVTTGACVAASGLIPSVQSTAIVDIQGFSADIGEVGAPAVPAPGAVLLTGLGAGLVGWLRQRRAL